MSTIHKVGHGSQRESLGVLRFFLFLIIIMLRKEEIYFYASWDVIGVPKVS